MKEYGEKVTGIINKYIEEKLEQAKQFVRDKMEQAKQYFVDKFEEMKRNALQKGQEIVQAAKNKFEDAKRAIREKINEAKKYVENKIGEIPSVITRIGPKLFNAGRNIITSLIDGIKSRVSSITSTMGDVASTIRGFLPFSPAKFGPLKDIMKIRIAESIAESINKGKRVATRAMTNLANEIGRAS